MSNTCEHICDLVKHLPDVSHIRSQLDKVVYRYTKDQIDLMNEIRQFLDSVQLIQDKTKKTVPVLFQPKPTEGA